MCKKIQLTSSDFRPKVGQSSPQTKFQIFTSPQNGGGQFAPTLDSFYQTLKAVTCKCQFSGVVRGQTAAILAKNVRRGGSSGQTGSRNMAATRFLDFSTPTSYSTPNTLLGLSRTVTELPSGAVTINAIVKASATRKYSVKNEFFQLWAHFSWIVELRFSLNFQSPQHVQLREVTYGPKYRPPRPLATGTENPQKNLEIRFSHKMAAKTTSGSGFRQYSCSPPSTWLIQLKIAKIFQGHFFEIFGVKVKKFKNILNELQEFRTCIFLIFCGRCTRLPLCQNSFTFIEK